MDKEIKFFMGANSPNGFYSFYDEIRRVREGYRSYIIKGGPGTGKSGLMRRVADSFKDKDELIEKIHCSSDPYSLDGVVLHTAKCSIVDATPPHVIEPSYPGGYETVINICDFIDEKKAQERLEKTIELQTENAECHSKCRRLIRCADILLKENAYYAEAATDFEKINAVGERIAKLEFKEKGEGAIEHSRLLSAVTNQGVVVFSETPSALCDRIYAFKDEFGVSSSALLRLLKDKALKKGYEIFACYCPLTPDYKLEHLFIRDLRLGFVTENRFNGLSEPNPYKVMHFSRFTDMDKLKEKKQYIRFNRKLALALIDAAADSLKTAKKIHDEIENQYSGAVDFAAVTKKTDDVIEKIRKRYE